MKATLENFVEFVRTRNPDRKISHGSWFTCAVGEFIDYCNRESGKDAESGEDVLIFIGTVIYYDKLLDKKLSNATSIEIPNYGAFTEWLEDNGYIVKETSK